MDSLRRTQNPCKDPAKILKGSYHKSFVKILQDLVKIRQDPSSRSRRILQDLEGSWQDLTGSWRIVARSYRILKDRGKILPGSWRIIAGSYQDLEGSWQDLTRILKDRGKILPGSWRIVVGSWRIVARSYQDLGILHSRKDPTWTFQDFHHGNFDAMFTNHKHVARN